MKHARPDYDRIQDPAQKIPWDEPVFLLRAQDRSAPFIVREWASMNQGFVSDELVEMARKHAEAMEEWQRVHGSKVADLPAPDDGEPKTQLSGGEPVTDDHREINPETGQQKGYVVLTAEERAKGFVRPVRRSYVHKACGGVTRMAQDIAETYARDPKFYSGTFCVDCRQHFPLDQFHWLDAPDEQVGS